MKKIAVLTGTRAEYGILKPVIQAIQDNPELELSLLVSGTHLSKEFGFTANDIEKDGLRIDAKVDMLPETDTLAGMARSVGKGIGGMVDAFEQIPPDILLVLGDRTEPLAATIAAAYLNIPVAHIHGGDACTGGTIDDSNRFAITKFAHIHFPATAKSAERILKLGEEPWRIHQVGSPAIDGILQEHLPESSELAAELGLDLSKKLIMVLQHSITTQVEQAAGQMRETLDAALEFKYPIVVIYPNSDPGGRHIINVIKEYESNPLITTFPNLPRRYYLGLLTIADVLVGNSSSGLIDAPSFGLPVVNVGIRQENRERGSNVLDAGHSKAEIAKAIDAALNDTELRSKIKNAENPYGDGKASLRITEVLEKIRISPELLQKKITY